MDIKVTPVVYHAVDLGGTKLNLDQNNFSGLSLWLAYALNAPNPYPLTLDTMQGDNVTITVGDRYYLVGQKKISKEAMKKFSQYIPEYSLEYESFSAILMGMDDWEQNCQDLFIHVTKLGVIAMVYQDHPEESDLPIGVLIDQETKTCRIVNAKWECKPGASVSSYYFDRTCLIPK